MEPLRIGIDIYQAGFQYGGIPRYVRALIPAMASASPEDRFVLFSNYFRPGHSFWSCPQPNIRHVKLRLPRQLVQTGWDRLRWPSVEMITGGLDVFHGTHFVLPAVRNAKTVLTVHDLIFLRHPEYFSDLSLNRKEHGKRLTATLHRADLMVAVSESTRRDLIELLKVPEDRIRVVHEGVDPLFFIPENDPELKILRTRLHLDRPYLVFVVGTPEPRKNVHRTLAAARLAAPDMPLVMVGPKAPLTVLLKGDRRGTILIGSLSDRDLALVLHGAMVALYPSLAEGFGLPALEALAAGVPLVTSNCSALPEVVGDTAVLVNPHSTESIAEAIRGLIGDEGRRQALSQAGRKRALAFSWQRAARQTLALYREMS